jgi:1,4-alpha-glucan branching enzyme
VAYDHYEENFVRSSQGICLPERTYYEGVEKMLTDAGLHYFLVDGYSILFARPRFCYRTYAPIFRETGVVAFGLDHESSQQVWSFKVGYPGDLEYREFYKYLGWKAEYKYIKLYIMPNGQRKNIGIKYHKIISRQAGFSNNTLYDIYWAGERVAEHAGHLIHNQ